MLKKIASDFKGIREVFGTGVALRWLGQIVMHARQCLKTRRLNAADLSMGEGPFVARRKGTTGPSAKLLGAWSFALAREIWVRDVYLGGGHFRLEPGATVLDLGANRGVFTARALTEQPAANVIAVEPRRSDCGLLRRLVDLNGWRDRVRICNCFLGGVTEWQERLLSQEQEEYGGVPFLDEAGFLQTNGVTRIDFLKCDIEGSEYTLLTPGSRMLAITRQLAMELHDFAGDRNQFLDMLRQVGFEVVIYRESPGDCIVHAWRREAQARPATAAAAE